LTPYFLVRGRRDERLAALLLPLKHPQPRDATWQTPDAALHGGALDHNLASDAANWKSNIQISSADYWL
jgi:hypothetical protein